MTCLSSCLDSNLPPSKLRLRSPYRSPFSYASLYSSASSPTIPSLKNRRDPYRTYQSTLRVNLATIFHSEYAFPFYIAALDDDPNDDGPAYLYEFSPWLGFSNHRLIWTCYTTSHLINIIHLSHNL
jgi:hypothetical protein